MRKEIWFLVTALTLLSFGGMTWWLSRQLTSRLSMLDQKLDQTTVGINRDNALLQELLKLEIAYDTLSDSDPKRALIDSLFVLQTSFQTLNETFDRHISYMTDSVLGRPTKNGKLAYHEMSQAYWMGVPSATTEDQGMGQAFLLKIALSQFAEQVGRINAHFSTQYHTRPSQIAEAFAPADSLFFEEGWRSWEQAHFSGSPVEIVNILHLLQENQLDFLFAEVKWIVNWKPEKAEEILAS